MKFGKEFASQMVPEWQEKYMNYKHLKTILKGILKFHKLLRENSQPPPSKVPSLKGTLSSGLTTRPRNDNEEEMILMNAMQRSDEEQGGDGQSYEKGVAEHVFFTELNQEFEKVIQFYETKVAEVCTEADKLSVQLHGLILRRIKVHNPPVAAATVSPTINETNTGPYSLEVIQEEQQQNISDDARKYKFSATQGTPLSIITQVFRSFSLDFCFNKIEDSDAQERLKQAFIAFHQNLRFLQNYVFLNQLAFSKIMKKHDKITSTNASVAFLKKVEESILGQSDEVVKLIEKVESTFVQHFCNGNRTQGMNTLRPQTKREKHRITFFMGCFFGFSLALVVAIIVTVHLRDLLKSKGRTQYMDTLFALYSLFGFLVLHMLMYAGNVYFWRRYRINYTFIFGFKPRTELGYNKVLLLSFGLSVLTLSAVLSNLEMKLEPGTKSYKALTELLPLVLLVVVLLIIVCPFDIVYRATRYFFLVCVMHCICAPLYLVTLPDFFLADQFTSQVQLLRNLQFYVCYYGWGDYKKRNAETCNNSEVYDVLFIVIAVVPFWIRLLQCIRRLFEKQDSSHSREHVRQQALNGLKYFSIIVAVVTRALYSQRPGITMKIIAASTSGFATIFSTYWDLVIDWGLLKRDSKNPWLRDKLILPSRSIYFIAMVLNVILRLAWMQTVMDLHETPFLHRNVVIAIVASLEIIRRGIWNFFRLENEHLNNVEQYRVVKSVPLPFTYEDEYKNL